MVLPYSLLILSVLFYILKWICKKMSKSFSWFFLFLCEYLCFTLCFWCLTLIFHSWQTGAQKAYTKFKHFTDETVDQGCRTITYRCCLCGTSSNSFKLLNTECEQNKGKTGNESSSKVDDEVKLACILSFA